MPLRYRCGHGWQMDHCSDARRAGRNTIGDLLTRSAERYRDKVALRWNDAAWTYRALDDAANRAGAALLASGLAPGDRVVAYGRNSDLYLLAWLGCCKAGLVHVAANYALTATELRYIAEQSGARLVLHDPALAANADAAGVRAATFADAVKGVPGILGEDVTDESIAQFCYTSGTTGSPKGAVMTHRALMSEYVSCIVECEHSAADRVLAARAAVSHRATALLHHAATDGGGGDRADRGPRAGAVPGADRAAPDHLVLRAADGVDQPAAASGFRPGGTCPACSASTTARRSCRCQCSTSCAPAYPVCARSTATARARCPRWRPC